MNDRSLTYDVVCLGCCCWDVMALCDEYPCLDQKRPLGEMCEQGGGQAATASAAIAKLGGSVAFVGRIGDDTYGANIRGALEDVGVDVSWGLQVVPGARSQWAFCVAEKATGQRAIFWRASSTGGMGAADLDRAKVIDARAVLVDGHHPAASIAAARWAHEAGVPVVADLERHRPDLDELLSLTTYPVLPEDFALEWAGAATFEEAGGRLAPKAGGTLVITLGTRGSVAFTPKGLHHQPAFVMDPVVDTTGAGDVYHGAFALAIGRGQSLEEAMRFASAAAAASCRALGGRAGLATADEVEAMLARG